MTDHELWAIAQHLLKRDVEEGGRLFITARIGEMAQRDDEDGANAWKLTAARFQELVEGERSGTRQ